jgi:hypothetical protein
MLLAVDEDVVDKLAVLELVVPVLEAAAPPLPPAPPVPVGLLPPNALVPGRN